MVDEKVGMGRQIEKAKKRPGAAEAEKNFIAIYWDVNGEPCCE